MLRGRRRCRREYWASRPKPSAYISSIETLKPSEKVVLWVRVSRRQQDHSGNLDSAEANLRAEAEKRGLDVVDVYRYVGSGKSACKQWYDAAWLARDHGAKLLAETTNRFIRHPLFHSKDYPSAQAKWNHFREMAECVGNVTLVTVLDPNAAWRQEWSYLTKRGIKQKGAKVGRPKSPKPGAKKERRLRMIPMVQEMKSNGMSNRAIARALEINEKTVRRWVRLFCSVGHHAAND